MRARSYRLIRVFSGVLVAVLAFTLGFMVRSYPNFLASLGFPESITGIGKTVADPESSGKDVYSSLSMRVAEVEDVLASDSLDTYDLDVVSESVLSAFAKSSDDPYLRYYSASSYELLQATQNTGYTGIGVLFSEYNGQAYVVDVFEGSQAQQAGVQVGDFVQTVYAEGLEEESVTEAEGEGESAQANEQSGERADGKASDAAEAESGDSPAAETAADDASGAASSEAASSQAAEPSDQADGAVQSAEEDAAAAMETGDAYTWSRSEVTSLISQSIGSNITITWRRPASLEADGGQEFTTTLPCMEFEEPNVSYQFDEERKVGFIGVKQLTQNVASVTADAVSALKKQGAEAFVLDLRNNPGGYLNQAVDLASLFMSSGTVVQIRTRDGLSAKAATGQPATDLPLVVITNKNTAAAAEVVAAALKESQRATLVGMNTLGKGSVQVLHDLSFGGAIRYTAAYYLTPETHDIDRVGVAPDLTFDASRDGTSLKKYAMEVAASLAAQA